MAGSSEGYSGHVDGKLRDARMSHPRGLTVDQRGNIYIADTKNKAIRKISDAGTFVNQFQSISCLKNESCLVIDFLFIKFT